MPEEKARVTPWGDGNRPGEADVRRMFAAEGLQPYRWSNHPYDEYSAHTHAYNKAIIVVQGSITFGLPEVGKELALFAGDRLDLPRGTVHSAVVGAQGVVCLEAHY